MPEFPADPYELLNVLRDHPLVTVVRTGRGTDTDVNARIYVVTVFCDSEAADQAVSTDG